jgi:hypothetical protein
MRRILSAALVLGAIFVNVMASGKIAETDTTKTRIVVHGLYVAQPTNMKNLSGGASDTALIAQRGPIRGGPLKKPAVAR